MKPRFHKITPPLESSFSLKHTVSPNFGRIWHFHPELELHYIVRGKGVRFIGDNVDNFAEGELILLGQNLPHTWRCDEIYYQNYPEIVVEAIVLQFLPDCLGKTFFELPETFLISKLFEKALQGLLVVGQTKARVIQLLHQGSEAEGLERLIVFIQILKALAESKEYTTIASSHAFYKSSEKENQRLNTIYTYTLANFRREITLQEVAAITHLSVTSFCRYFKMMTKKPYYDFLIELRVSHACRMLIEDKFPIEVVCFDCGFNNVSNFYRHFRKVTGMTPLEYKRKFIEKGAA
jgi:AraC-like DNA-binding protein